MEALAAVLAHEGGWDEILMVAAPLGAIAALLWLANRRANRRAEIDASDHDEATSDSLD